MPLIHWTQYLTIQATLNVFTANPHAYVKMWLKIFNPFNLPYIRKSALMQDMELLARGCFTKEATLISEQFARDVYTRISDMNLLLSKDNFADEGDIDASGLESVIRSGQFDLEFINKYLRPLSSDIDEADLSERDS